MAKLVGTAEDDVIKGTRRDDVIRGLGGDDDLNGGDGDDLIIGGKGDDLSLRGGRGNDVFRFATGDGTDQIADYQLGSDGLDLHLTTFGLDDLRDVQIGGKNNDSDKDGNFVRETSSNGEPEILLIFNTEKGFQVVDIVGISLRQLINDTKANPDHYDFF